MVGNILPADTPTNPAGTVNRFKYNFFRTESCCISNKIVSEYDQEIPQSQTADNPVAPRGRAAQPSQDTRKTN